MSTRTHVEDSIRAWIVIAGYRNGIDDADAKVIIADQDGPKPRPPYISIRLDRFDEEVHTDETLQGIDPSDGEGRLFRARGLRTGVASITAFGRSAEYWLERSALMLNSPSVRALLNERNIALRRISPVVNLSRTLDDRTEARFMQDFRVDYERESSETETEELVELELVEHEDDYGERVLVEEVDLTE